ncbi:DENN domain-containing protein 1C isoform X2 [Rhinatrema bivittatum]|uniref:DENN domain-containing protein 1C isoform X2 n=1 Tax=Rhinatrema bivittatum TaxID=194408 RepID=UPI00112D24E6|nr:DENN domain-containing protein 1C isoform X2 [Rhinatrema bivittatum]
MPFKAESTFDTSKNALVKETTDPTLLRQFPEQFDQESIQTLSRFCFPFDVERVKENTVVQHFTFVLTDLEGNQRFGFCRLAVAFKTCLCILSYLPWFEVFYKLLNNLADHLAKEQIGDMMELLTSLYNHPMPLLNSTLSLHFLSNFIAPDSGSLPTIPESRNLTEFVVAVDVNNMLQLYASMLYERRILVTSSNLSTLTACIHASTMLLYPMYWQHIYIPMLPPHLLDYCCAPMPYLIGVHASLMERVKSKALEDIVMLNVDTNTLESPFEDLGSLPCDVVSLLKIRLKKQSATVGDGIARAFLRAQALLFGSYRDALICIPSEPISFCEESFLKHKSSSTRQFLQHAVHLQLFKQFIEGRLEKLNSGAGFSDVFEQEIDGCGLASGSSKSYQLWLENLKKGSDVLIHRVRNKANPAVKNMYRYAKGQAKMGLKEMRNRLRYKDLSTARELQRGGSLRCEQVTGPGSHWRSHDHLQSRLPITQHFGQVTNSEEREAPWKSLAKSPFWVKETARRQLPVLPDKKLKLFSLYSQSRPRRPNKKYQESQESSTWEAQREDEQETSVAPSDADQLPELEDDFLEEEEELDLLGEIFDTLSTQASGEQRILYGTRSLDFFTLEDNSYMTRVKSLDAPSNENLSSELQRDWNSCRRECWCLEEDSFEYSVPSSEEVSISEESGIQEGPGLTENALEVAPSTAAGNTRGLKRSGMWDRGINGEEKGAEATEPHHELSMGNTEAGNREAAAAAAKELNYGETEREKDQDPGAPCELPGSAAESSPPREEEMQVYSASPLAEPVVSEEYSRAPNGRCAQPEAEGGSAGPSVQSAVALFQAKAQQRPDKNVRRGRFPISRGLQEWPAEKKDTRLGKTLGTAPQTAGQSLLLQTPPPDPCDPSPPCVAELKKRFEA